VCPNSRPGWNRDRLKLYVFFCSSIHYHLSTSKRWDTSDRFSIRTAARNFSLTASMRACETYAQTHKTSEKYVISTTFILRCRDSLNDDHHCALLSYPLASRYKSWRSSSASIDCRSRIIGRKRGSWNDRDRSSATARHLTARSEPVSCCVRAPHSPGCRAEGARARGVHVRPSRSGRSRFSQRSQ